MNVEDETMKETRRMVIGLVSLFPQINALEMRVP
jgi:hypothetical protein